MPERWHSLPLPASGRAVSLDRRLALLGQEPIQPEQEQLVDGGHVEVESQTADALVLAR